jgi:hypothetical protein
MATTLNVCPAAVDVCITRGDSTPISFTLVDEAGAAIDNTGSTYLLTVDPSDEPADALENLFQLAQSNTPGSDGVVTFSPSTVDTDQTPDEYFFDVQQTDVGGNLRTVIKGKFTIQQDITKA